ncbi:MAG: tetratricopeptide repeat protein [Acidobacteria bacterium]|nr:tetratricopeptide repeat protein [Acidobacteriota bacterium]
MSFLFSRKPVLALIVSLLLGALGAMPAPAQDGAAPADAVAVFNQGQDAHEKGDLKTAIDLYRKALGIVPEFPEAEYQLGAACLALNRTDEAEAAFRRAVELRADWSLAMAGLGGVLVARGKFAEAEPILTRAVELDELNFPAYAALAELRLRTKAAPDVLRPLLAKLREFSSKASPPAAVWAARGALERSLGQKEEAKTSLARALAADPSNKSALAESAELALSVNDAAGALEFAAKLVKIAPDNPSYQILLARAYAAEGGDAEALKILDGLRNPPPEAAELRALINANSTAGAAELEKLLEKEPKNVAALGRLCWLLRVENPEKALDYCRRAYDLEPANLNYVIGYGAALVQAKQYNGAVELFRKITAAAPDNYTAHANLAIALFQLKRYEEAKTEYLWLAAKQPDRPITYYFLGIIYDSLTEYLDAMANYQQFLKLADAEKNKLEIDKVNLRLPSLQKQIKEKKGKRQ